MASTAESQVANLAGVVHSIPRESFAAANSILTKPADCGLSAGLVAIVLGALLVFFMFPRRDEEQQLLRRYHAEDIDPPATGEPL